MKTRAPRARSAGTTVSLTAGLVVSLWSCGAPDSDISGRGPLELGVDDTIGRAGDSDAVDATTTPRFPADAGAFAPSLAAATGEVDIELLADIEMCEGCHADAAAHFRSSAHARSSFDNPWYRAGVEAFREEVGAEASRFCAGCHDPLLLLSGKIDAEISPEDPLAHAGVTCMVCHGITRVSSEGTASWTLDTSPVPLPRRGDQASVDAHKARMATDPLRTAGLCGSCHRGFLSEATGNAHFLPGIDDAGPWRGSAYGGNRAHVLDDDVEEQTCQACHMPSVRATRGDAAATDGEIRGHRFAGAQTAIAEQGGDAEQRAVVEEMLLDAATIDIAALRMPDGSWALPADGAAVGSDASFEADVVVRNVGAGHRFPGGVRDTQDTWIELAVRDAHGEVVAEAGTRHERTEDDTAHRLMTVLLDRDGHPELRHFVNHFESRGWDHTIAPREADVTRYRVTLPTLPPEAFPLRVEARLRHRRHVRAVADVACQATRSRRGRAFNRAAESFGKPPLDGCAAQPVTDLARAAVYVGAGAGARGSEGGADRPTWRRLFEHALALTHDVQEHLDDARPSLARARALAEREEDPRALAMVLGVLARVEARQGRLEDALARVAEAEATVGEHPALARARGDAYAQVWRWEDAEAAYQRVTALAPGDSQAWRDLARAAGSARDDRTALAAAAQGLALLPRDESMLRSQALALESLGLPDAERARELFLTHRKPDAESDLRLACAQYSQLCSRDQQPVVVIEARTH